jgi:hypothetical protein
MRHPLFFAKAGPGSLLLCGLGFVPYEAEN